MMPDSKFPAGTFDPSEDVAVLPVAPSLATATLIRYEWRAVGPNGNTSALNALFADGWEYHDKVGVSLDGLSAETCILRRIAP